MEPIYVQMTRHYSVRLVSRAFENGAPACEIALVTEGDEGSERVRSAFLVGAQSVPSLIDALVEWQRRRGSMSATG